MKKYKAYLIDLDGTMYVGNSRILTAEHFVRELMNKSMPFLFVTNNATKSEREVIQNLKDNYDLDVPNDCVYTSGTALVDYLLANFNGKSIFLIGEEALRVQLEDSGFILVDSPDADIVVQSLDRQLSYSKLANATLAIQNGAKFIVTNIDSNIPTEQGLLPGSGAITAFLEKTTGSEPIVMGKPYSPILEGALNRLSLSREDVLMIGDNYNTDIRLGNDLGMDTLLLLTGFTKKEDLTGVYSLPTYILNDLSEWEL